ncbi:MAG: ABC transporter ATP-binding protein [Anaerolineae bacterium]
MYFVRPYRKWVLIAPLLMLLEVVMDLMQPRLIERIIDDGIAQGNLQLVLQIGLWMIGLALVGAFGGMSNGVFAVKAVQGFGADLREALFRQVQALSFGNLDELETGQLITRLTNDVNHVQEALLILLRILIRAPLLLVGSLVMAIVTSPSLVWLPLALVPLLLLAVLWVVKTATPMYGVVQQRLDQLNGVMQENLAGARVVKAFVRGRHEEERFGITNTSLVDQTIRVARVTAALMPFMFITLNLGIVGVLWFGGRQVIAGNMQLGQIVAFINYLLMMLFSLVMVSMLVVQISRAQASADRIQEVLESVPTVRTRSDVLRDFNPQGRVAFHNVSFRYNGNEQDTVLQDVSFVANPGDMVALVGTTGSGKSSLVNLIPRFYDVTSGRVTIDGIDVRDIDEQALRRHIGIALQETVLFSGTIRDNIRYGRPDAPHEEVEAAARMAQAHDFITSFPEGYDTMVGQRGVNLSGGQKQRMAVARALLMRPAVLILDDSTSSVDVETEAAIQKSLRSFMAGRTSFVIAQRISTVMSADKILVLEDGRIAAEGTHRELLTSSPIYREICESQLGSVNGEVANG